MTEIFSVFPYFILLRYKDPFYGNTEKCPYYGNTEFYNIGHRWKKVMPIVKLKTTTTTSPPSDYEEHEDDYEVQDTEGDSLLK